MSELELFIWASRNQALLLKLESATPQGKNDGMLKRLMIKAGISKPTPAAIEDETKGPKGMCMCNLHDSPYTLSLTLNTDYL